MFYIFFIHRTGSCFCYYGHCLNTSNIGENIFMSYFLANSVEIFSWSLPYLINKLGRKLPLVAFFFCTGCFGFLYVLILDCKFLKCIGITGNDCFLGVGFQ